jgi:hypothetical protein
MVDTVCFYSRLLQAELSFFFLTFTYSRTADANVPLKVVTTWVAKRLLPVQTPSFWLWAAWQAAPRPIRGDRFSLASDAPLRPLVCSIAWRSFADQRYDPSNARALTPLPKEGVVDPHRALFLVHLRCSLGVVVWALGCFRAWGQKCAPINLCSAGSYLVLGSPAYKRQVYIYLRSQIDRQREQSDRRHASFAVA